MKRAVRFSPGARAQATEIARWWRLHRPASPRLFARELRHAIELASEAPEIGVTYPHPRLPGVRRLLLSGSRFHVYYVLDEIADAVEVVAVWSAVRGRGPDDPTQ